VALDSPDLVSTQDVTVRFKPPPKPAPPAAKTPYEPPTPPRERELNQLNMRLVWINPGKFLMGSPPNEERRDPRDEHLHEVTISRGFYLGAFEVTQEQFQQLMGRNPSLFVDKTIPKPGAKPGDFTTPAGGSFGEAGPPRLPVERVTWDDAAAFCNALSALPGERLAGRRYRLPTEAEWEYACRAGTRTAFSWGPSAFDIRTFAWGFDNSARTTHAIGLKKPNKWGLYDMHGNVAEWCHDWYQADYYQNCPPADPQGPALAQKKVVRGGAFTTDELNRPPSQLLRCAQRFDVFPATRSEAIGFRVACDLVEPATLEQLRGEGQPPVIIKPN
jgi:formylglycine-generating enzyme required for sulfatase activity